MKRGDVCLAHFPFTDASAAKLRPILIVSTDVFNSGDDVVVLPISSNPEADDHHAFRIDSSSPHFKATGLRFSSAIKWTKPMTIAKCVITRRLGKLENGIMTRICQLLSQVIL